MNSIEVRFLDEYKRTDALCREIYGMGVSEYIFYMESATPNRRSGSAGWRDEYYTLKHLRWLRNRITHDAVASECREADIKKIVDFRSRLAKGADAVGIAKKRRTAAGTAAKSAATGSSQASRQTNGARHIRVASNGRAERDGSLWVTFAVIAFILTALYFCVKNGACDFLFG